MGGSSSPQNASSGLSSLFLGNQPTQTGQSSALAPITAPQSLIGQLDMSQLPAMPQPAAAPAPQASASSYPFKADRRNAGYGWMQVYHPPQSGGGDMAHDAYYTSEYVPAPNPQPAVPSPVRQPSQSALIAQLINSQFGKK